MHKYSILLLLILSPFTLGFNFRRKYPIRDKIISLDNEHRLLIETYNTHNFKMKLEDKDLIVRSPYFQTKVYSLTNEIDTNNIRYFYNNKYLIVILPKTKIKLESTKPIIKNNESEYFYIDDDITIEDIVEEPKEYPKSDNAVIGYVDFRGKFRPY